MSSLGNSVALLPVAGAKVDSGQVVAAGASVGGQETGVYFELRIQGGAVDPARWITS